MGQDVKRSQGKSPHVETRNRRIILMNATALKYIEQPKNQYLIELLKVPRTVPQIAFYMKVKQDSARANLVRLEGAGVKLKRERPSGKRTRYSVGMPAPRNRHRS